MAESGEARDESFISSSVASSRVEDPADAPDCQLCGGRMLALGLPEWNSRREWARTRCYCRHRAGAPGDAPRLNPGAVETPVARPASPLVAYGTEVPRRRRNVVNSPLPPFRWFEAMRIRARAGWLACPGYSATLVSSGEAEKSCKEMCM